MTIDDIIDQVAALDGVLVLRPQPGDGSPQISWGDVFFYFRAYRRGPEDPALRHDRDQGLPGRAGIRPVRPGAFRLNIGVPASASTPQSTAQQPNASTPDAWFPHPVYGRAGWISVVDPAERTAEEAMTLLETAHAAARRRYQRRLPD